MLCEASDRLKTDNIPGAGMEKDGSAGTVERGPYMARVTLTRPASPGERPHGCWNKIRPYVQVSAEGLALINMEKTSQSQILSISRLPFSDLCLYISSQRYSAAQGC